MKSLTQSMNNFPMIDSASRLIKTLNRTDSKRASRTKFTIKKTFAPSAVGYGSGRCARRWYYAFNGANAKDEPGSRGIRMMESGTDRHERFEKLLTLMGDDVIAIEEELNSTSPPVRGFIDGQLRWEDQDWIIEFKTSAPAAFKALKASGKPPSYHIVQILLYMYIKNYTYGMLIYESRETFDMVSIPIKMEGELDTYTNMMVGWMNRVYEAIKEDEEVPERCFTQKSYECKYCPFKKVCWDDDTEPTVSIPRLKEFKY
jgi:CRISPR/Cas system-associated exonuclease Cas4 (RecB family)